MMRYQLEAMSDALGMNVLIVASLSDDSLAKDILSEINYLKKRVASMSKFINIPWSEVFDSQRHFPLGYAECQKLALGAHKSYIAFNGRVLLSTEWVDQKEICLIEDLIGDRYAR